MAICLIEAQYYLIKKLQHDTVRQTQSIEDGLITSVQKEYEKKNATQI